MELTQYIRIIRKWLWLIILAAIVVGGVSYYSARNQPIRYQTGVTLAIGTYFQSPNPNMGEITTGINLVSTYAALVTRYDVLEATVNALDLPVSPEGLANAISVNTIADTSLLQIIVTWTNPETAADIANTLAEQLIDNSPTNLSDDQLDQMEEAQAQIDALNVQLQDLRNRLVTLNEELQSVREADEMTRLTVERNTTIDQINQSAATVAQFTSTIASLQQRTNSLDIVEQARVPSRSITESPMRGTIVGAATGGVVALIISLVIEYMDSTVKTSVMASDLLHLPVIGVIPRFGRRRDKYHKRLLHRLAPQSIITEGYRKLRTTLMFSLDNQRYKTYVITSPGPGEGKSLTTANLAISMASAGLHVVLIDGDLRRPKLHDIFELTNDKGLSSLLYIEFSSNGATPDPQLERERRTQHLTQVIHSTIVPRLRVITSGPIPLNPTEILGSNALRQWVDILREATDVDVIIFDTPPCLAMADSEVVAASTDAEVLLVIDARRTRRAAALTAKMEFEKIGKGIRGIILNRANISAEYGRYGYGYAASRIPVTRSSVPEEIKN